MTGTSSNAASLARTWRRAAAPRATRASAFARGVMARYGRAAMRPGTLLLVLLRRADMVTVNHHAGRTENHFGASLPTVVVHDDVAATAAGLRAQPASPSTASNAGTGHADLRTSATMSARLGPELPDTLPRAAARVAGVAPTVVAPAAAIAPMPGMPVPARPGASTDTSPTTGADMDMPPLRPRAARPQTTAIETPLPPAAAAPATTRATAASPAQPLPPQEIERIAERVLGSIDRRILAERERRGRF